MPQKGDLIGTIRGKIGRKDGGKPTGMVSLNEVGGEPDTEYFCVLKPPSKNSPLDTDVEFVQQTQNNRARLTVPRGILSEHGLKPGHSYVMKVYESVPTDGTEQEALDLLADATDGGQTEDIEQLIREIHDAVVTDD